MLPKEYHSAARLRNRRPLNEDGTQPECLHCGATSKKHVGRNRWYATCGNKLCSETLRLQKMIATKRAPEYKEIATVASRKAIATQRAMLINGISKANLTAQKIKIKNNQVDQSGLSGYCRAARKAASAVRHSNEAAGNWLPVGSKSAFDEYRRQVSACQRKFNKHIRQLRNYELRGPSGTEGAYHIDHKVSLWFGFTNNIDAGIIGHLCNLEMKPWLENNKKWSKSDITVKQLQEAINLYDLTQRSAHKPSELEIFSATKTMSLTGKL